MVEDRGVANKRAKQPQTPEKGVIGWVPLQKGLKSEKWHEGAPFSSPAACLHFCPALVPSGGSHSLNRQPRDAQHSFSLSRRTNPTQREGRLPFAQTAGRTWWCDR